MQACAQGESHAFKLTRMYLDCNVKKETSKTRTGKLRSLPHTNHSWRRLGLERQKFSAMSFYPVHATRFIRNGVIDYLLGKGIRRPDAVRVPGKTHTLQKVSSLR